jgi:hypothetical protein
VISSSAPIFRVVRTWSSPPSKTTNAFGSQEWLINEATMSRLVPSMLPSAWYMLRELVSIYCNVLLGLASVIFCVVAWPTEQYIARTSKKLREVSVRALTYVVNPKMYSNFVDTRCSVTCDFKPRNDCYCFCENLCCLCRLRIWYRARSRGNLVNASKSRVSRLCLGKSC